MKKVKINNKGFSLVELIIVIAIMAILAAALAPQLIKYLDNSRKSTDVSTGQSIATVVGVALTDEAAYNDAIADASGIFWISKCVTGAPATDLFELKVAELLGGAPPVPKYKASATPPYNDFAIVIKKDGSTISYAIYPSPKDALETDADELAADMVYPTVGANYLD